MYKYNNEISMANFPLALAEQYLGPVRIIQEKDFILDVRSHNKNILRQVLIDTGWTGEEILYISPKKNHGRKQLFYFILSELNITFKVIEGNLFSIAWKLLFVRHRKNRIAIAGFRSHQYMPIIRKLLGPDSKIIFDSLVSVYDTLCGDRAIFYTHSPVGYLAKKLDILLCNTADIVLVDTEETADYFEDELAVQRPRVVYADCNPAFFLKKNSETHKRLHCLWYGSNQPLHGIPKVMEFVNACANLPISFTFIGPIDTKTKSLLTEEGRKIATFLPAVPLLELTNFIAKADVCISGPFGSSRKAQSVICTKTFEMLRCGKHVLVADNYTHQRVFGELGVELSIIKPS